MKKSFILILVIGVIAACKPTTEDCGGKAEEEIYGKRPKDSIFLPFFHQDTFKYTLQTSFPPFSYDTLVMVKSEEYEENVVTEIDTERDCPYVRWGTNYHFKYVDTANRDSLNFTIKLFTSGISPRERYDISICVSISARPEWKMKLYSEDNFGVRLGGSKTVTVLGKEYDNVMHIDEVVYELMFQENKGPIFIIDLFAGKKFQLLPE